MKLIVRFISLVVFVVLAILTLAVIQSNSGNNLAAVSEFAVTDSMGKRDGNAVRPGEVAAPELIACNTFQANNITSYLTNPVLPTEAVGFESLHPVPVIILAGSSSLVGKASVDDILNAKLRGLTSMSNKNLRIFDPKVADYNLYTAAGINNGKTHGLEVGILDYMTSHNFLIPIHLIRYGVAETTIKDWIPPSENPTSNRYQTLMFDYIYAGLRRLRERRFRPYVLGFVWVSGEKDGLTPGGGANFDKNLHTFLFRLRQDLGCANLPIYVVKSKFKSLNSDKTTVLNCQQKVVEDLGPTASLINTNDFTLLDQSAFDSTSQIKLGNRLMDAMLKYWETNNTSNGPIEIPF